jgi:hypothetical protein
VTTGKGKFQFDVSFPTAGLIAQGTHEWQQKWQWEESRDGNNWTKFDETSHTIFIIPGDPDVSWELASSRPAQRPWEAVMRLVCDWAGGSKKVDDAAEMVTENIYGLGGKTVWRNGKQIPIRYHTGGVDYNFSNQFELGPFLRLANLEGDARVAPQFNCADGAGAAVVLSNALGCQLKMVRLCPSNNAPTFRTSAVLRAGCKIAQPENFAVHAAAVSAGNAQCWEVCIKVDLDSVAPLDLVTAHPFGPGKNTYLTRLISGEAPDVFGQQTVLVAETGDVPTDVRFCPAQVARLRRMLAGPQASEPTDKTLESIRTKLVDSAIWSQSQTVTIHGRSFEQVSGLLSIEDGKRVTSELWLAVLTPHAEELVVEIAVTSAAEIQRIAEYTERVIGNDQIGEYLLIWGRLVMRVRHPKGRAGLNEVLKQIAPPLVPGLPGG